jgi:outer membrane immunogenic protein
VGEPVRCGAALLHKGENLHMRTLRASVAGLAVGVVALAVTVPAVADGPPGSAYYERPYQPSIWQGLYGGVHLGWGESGVADGFVGGAQIGYNWQKGQVVYGLEADVSLADISYEERFMGVTAKASIDWLATARGRVGFLLTPRILAYGTAGFGIASASASASVPGVVKISVDDTQTDIVYGLGLEGKVSEAMSLRVEYLAFGDHDVGVVRAGLNFKFGN